MDKDEKKGTANETVKKMATVEGTCGQCGEDESGCPCITIAW